MYLKVECPLEFLQIAQRLAPEAELESFAWDYENVYEWLYVRLPSLPFRLNVSREHGQFVAEDFCDNSVVDAKPGATYITDGENSGETLPDWLAQHVADELQATVFVYPDRFNCEAPDPPPIAIVRPHLSA